MNCFLNKHTKNQYWPLLDISHCHFMEAFNGDDFHNLWFCLNVGNIWLHLMIILTLFENYQLKQGMILCFSFIFRILRTEMVVWSWFSKQQPPPGSGSLLLTLYWIVTSFCNHIVALLNSTQRPRKNSSNHLHCQRNPQHVHYLQVHLVHDILITMERSSSVFHSIIT